MRSLRRNCKKYRLICENGNTAMLSFTSQWWQPCQNAGDKHLVTGLTRCGTDQLQLWCCKLRCCMLPPQILVVKCAWIVWIHVHLVIYTPPQWLDLTFLYHYIILCSVSVPTIFIKNSKLTTYTLQLQSTKNRTKSPESSILYQRKGLPRRALCSNSELFENSMTGGWIKNLQKGILSCTLIFFHKNHDS